MATVLSHIMEKGKWIFNILMPVKNALQKKAPNRKRHF
jgi:hypothetical protein